MKKFLPVLAIMGMMLFLSPNAFAFSTEQRDGANDDGTAKFQDPDDQKPAFMVTPGGSQSGMQALPFGAATNSVTPPAPGDRNAGAAAFDKAYSHLQNQ